MIGASGFIGRYLLSSYRLAYPDCVGTGFRHASADLVELDLRRPDVSRLRLRQTGHQAVIVCAACPNIAYCQKEPEASRAVNVTGTLELVRQLDGLPVLFLSSDYVFDGSRGGYTEDDIPCPNTEYGRQKAEVERALPQLTDQYLILRLSKTYGFRRGDGTLLDELASTLMHGGVVQAASDQVFSPTFVGDVVDAIQHLQAEGRRGLVNLAAPEPWSRFDIAKQLAVALGVPHRVHRIRLADIPALAGRPLDTSLRSRRFDYPYTPLQQGIDIVTKQWVES